MFLYQLDTMHNSRQADVLTQMTSLRCDLHPRLRVCVCMCERERREHCVFQTEATLQMRRLLPGVRGRLVDMCRPSHQRYNTAVNVGLGKNMEVCITVGIS
jgi:hypothetical protein